MYKIFMGILCILSFCTKCSKCVGFMRTALVNWDQTHFKRSAVTWLEDPELGWRPEFCHPGPSSQVVTGNSVQTGC